MSAQIQTQAKAQTKSGFTPVSTSLLQRKCACGNHTMGGQCAVCGKQKRLGLQAKLKISEPGDSYEQEADRIAAQLMATPARPASGDAPLRIQRYSGQANGQMGMAPASVDHVLASPGEPLEPALRQDMEQHFSYDFSGVRVHLGEVAAQSARDVSAHAYTVGRHIVFGAGRYASDTNDGRRLLAHELVHVVQQSTPSESSGLVAQRTSPRVARQRAPAGGMSKGRVVGGARVNRVKTLVRIHVVGHASPRWRAAKSADEADRLNAALSEARAQTVRTEVERQVRAALPNHDLDVRYDYTPIDPRVERGGVILGTESRGSRETLAEAGKRGRAANEPEMRRVDVMVNLSAFTETSLGQVYERTRSVSAATRDWAVKVGLTAQVEAGAGGGYIVFRLKNRKSGEEMTAHGWVDKAGLGVSFPVGASVSWGDYTNFTTKEPANFSDFDWINFSIRTHSVNLILIGYEWAELTFFDLPGGYVDGIDVGGWTSGQIGLDLYSRSYGAMALEGSPKDTYRVKVRETTFETSRFESSEEHAHRVLFETNESGLSLEEREQLKLYVEASVRNYEEGTKIR